MMWSQVRLLIPSFFAHWALLVVLATTAWYFWTRVYTHIQFKWEVPVLLASVFHLVTASNTVVSMYQNGVLYAFSQSQQQGQAQQQQKKEPLDPALQMKADFLKAIEVLVGNPDQINADNKKKLFNDFAKLFPKGKADRADYAKNVTDVYQCQLLFWEDAVASFKAKQPIKGDERVACEDKAGGFYNRPKLIPAELVKANDATIAEIAARKKRVPASDGKEVDLTEAMLKEALEAQIKANYNLKKIFE